MLKLKWYRLEAPAYRRKGTHTIWRLVDASETRAYLGQFYYASVSMRTVPGRQRQWMAEFDYNFFALNPPLKNKWAYLGNTMAARRWIERQLERMQAPPHIVNPVT